MRYCFFVAAFDRLSSYIGVLCDSNFGFGVSGSLRGNFQNMDSAVVWDLMVVMHEIG